MQFSSVPSCWSSPCCFSAASRVPWAFLEDGTMAFCPFPIHGAAITNVHTKWSRFRDVCFSWNWCWLLTSLINVGIPHRAMEQERHLWRRRQRQPVVPRFRPRLRRRRSQGPRGGSGRRVRHPTRLFCSHRTCNAPDEQNEWRDCEIKGKISLN